MSDHVEVEVVQQTLSGGTQLLADIEDLREKPSTMLWCETCEDFILRSRRYEHDHDLVTLDELEDDEDDVTVTTDEPEEIGAWYDVEIHVSVEYRFRIPAYSKHEAENIAGERRFDTQPADSYVVHTRTDERGTITTEDVPDDYDLYGGTQLWEVFQDDDE